MEINIQLKKVTIPDLFMNIRNDEQLKNSNIYFNIETNKDKKDGDIFDCFIEIQVVFLHRENEESNGDTILYITLRGEFSTSGIGDDDIEQFLRVNGCAILYPYLRERISSLTSMAGMEPYFLPSTNFVNVYEDWVRKQKIKNNN